MKVGRVLKMRIKLLKAHKEVKEKINALRREEYKIRKELQGLDNYLLDNSEYVAKMYNRKRK